MVPNRWVAWYYTIERFWTTRDFFSDSIARPSWRRRKRKDLHREGKRNPTGRPS
jgi:hypothetical protein